MVMMKIVFAAALSFAASAAVAGPNLVTNGSFEQSSYTQSQEFGVDYGGQGVTGWTASLPGGFSVYWVAANDPTSQYALNRFGDTGNKLALSYPGPSPDGGNFLGLDGDFQGDAPPVYGPYNSPIVQTLDNLTVGGRYKINFYWAATQLQNRQGPTTNRLDVFFGGSSFSTDTVSVPSQGFVGWMSESHVFTADATSQTLSFLAHGTPAGLPPFLLLDGVSVAAVPEPAAWALLLAGFGAVGVAARRRRGNVAAA